MLNIQFWKDFFNPFWWLRGFKEETLAPIIWVQEKFDSRREREEWKQMVPKAKHIWDEYFESRLTRQQAFEQLGSIDHPFFNLDVIYEHTEGKPKGVWNRDFLLDTADRYRETIKKEGITHLSQAHARKVAFDLDSLQRTKDTNEWRRKFISHGEEESP